MEPIKLLMIFLLLPCVSAFRNRIIGGKECPETGHRFLALLSLGNVPFCGGTLIRKDWVITAAHCYKSEEIQVTLGVHNLSLAKEHEQVRVGTSKTCFNTTDCTSFTDDIMLIQLDSPVECSAYVGPLDLADSCASVGTVCEVMGWGAITASGDKLKNSQTMKQLLDNPGCLWLSETYTEVPHCVDVDIVSHELCEEAYGPLVNEKMLCAGDMNGGKGSCQGDSGGPLICNEKLQGIVSFGGDPCAEPEQPGVYVNICKYLEWILSVIEEK